MALRYLDQLNAHRREVAGHYSRRLGELVVTPPERGWADPVYHMYVIRTRIVMRSRRISVRRV